MLRLCQALVAVKLLITGGTKDPPGSLLGCAYAINIVGLVIMCTELWICFLSYIEAPCLLHDEHANPSPQTPYWSPIPPQISPGPFKQTSPQSPW